MQSLTCTRGSLGEIGRLLREPRWFMIDAGSGLMAEGTARWTCECGRRVVLDQTRCPNCGVVRAASAAVTTVAPAAPTTVAAPPPRPAAPPSPPGTARPGSQRMTAVFATNAVAAAAGAASPAAGAASPAAGVAEATPPPSPRTATGRIPAPTRTFKVEELDPSDPDLLAYAYGPDSAEARAARVATTRLGGATTSPRTTATFKAPAAEAAAADVAAYASDGPAPGPAPAPAAAPISKRLGNRDALRDVAAAPPEPAAPPPRPSTRSFAPPAPVASPEVLKGAESGPPVDLKEKLNSLFGDERTRDMVLLGVALVIGVIFLRFEMKVWSASQLAEAKAYNMFAEDYPADIAKELETKGIASGVQKDEIQCIATPGLTGKGTLVFVTIKSSSAGLYSHYEGPSEREPSRCEQVGFKLMNLNDAKKSVWSLPGWRIAGRWVFMTVGLGGAVFFLIRLLMGGRE